MGLLKELKEWFTNPFAETSLGSDSVASKAS